jgi:PAS domain S-box-containing protein
MIEIIRRAFDHSDFVRRSQCGNWTDELRWLHTGSDLFIWLAYISIPLVLLYFVRRRRDLPFSRLFVLFALFILACGFTHFVDALMFNYPMYRLGGLVKLATAVVSWVTVLALIPVVPRVLELASAIGKAQTETTVHRPLREERDTRLRDYITAILAAVLAILIRAALDPLLGADQVFVVSLLAVVFVSWQCGFGPGIVTLLLSMVGMVYFFVSPRRSWVIDDLGNQMAVALFFFCGVACAGLGQAQRGAQQRAKEALSESLDQRAGLEAEVARRTSVEFALRQRETDLLDLNAQLARSQREGAEALAQLDTFVMNAPVGIAFYDTELRYVRVNNYLATVNRLPADAHIGKTTRELIPDFPDDLLADIRNELEPGAAPVARTVTTPTGPDGPEVTWQVIVFPVCDPTGDPLGVGVIAQDVTARVRAERELRASEERFRAFMNSSPNAKYVKDADGRFLVANRAFERLLGRPAAQIVGRTDDELVPPALAAHFRDQDQAVLRAGRPWQGEDTFEIDGRQYTTLTAKFPLPDGSIGAIRTDITDRKRAEEALRLSAERFRTLTEAVPQMVWTANARGEMTYFNARWNEYTGVPLEVGQTEGWGQVVHPDDEPAMRAGWRLAVVQGADRFGHEFRLRRASDDAYRWMLSSAIPLRDKNGAIVEWVGTLTDIDDQKRHAEQLEQMVRERTTELVATNAELREEVEERRRAEELVRATARELERSNSELEKFAYIASHDLQEPLRKIQAFGDRLQSKFRDQLPDGGRDYIDRMLGSAGRMRKLIDDLLVLSRVTSKAKPFEPIDLGAVVREVLVDLEVRLEQTKGRVDVGPLPRIDADPSQMRQLFQNLLGNALKFHRPGVPPAVRVRGELVPGPPGSEAVPAALRSEAAGTASVLGNLAGPAPLTCRVTVQDNGIGFEAKYRERIFEVFQRLHGRDEYEGTGVGLAICRKIVERHGGTITAHSDPGGGATFVVSLPVRQPREEADSDANRGQADHHPDGR